VYSILHPQPRLLVLLVLRLRFDSSLALFAMCCSSFVTISRSTTGRSVLLPMGNTSFPKVRAANLLASRHCTLREIINGPVGLDCLVMARSFVLLVLDLGCFGFCVYRQSVVPGIHRSNNGCTGL